MFIQSTIVNYETTISRDGHGQIAIVRSQVCSSFGPSGTLCDSCVDVAAFSVKTLLFHSFIFFVIDAHWIGAWVMLMCVGMPSRQPETARIWPTTLFAWVTTHSSLSFLSLSLTSMNTYGCVYLYFISCLHWCNLTEKLMKRVCNMCAWCRG